MPEIYLIQILENTRENAISKVQFEPLHKKGKSILMKKAFFSEVNEIYQFCLN